MNCAIIFYLAGRTGQIEGALEESLVPLGISIHHAAAAATEEELKKALAFGVSRYNLLFVIGGTKISDNRNAAVQLSKLLSLPLSSVNPPRFRDGTALLPEEAPESVFLESGRQALFLLPDNPEIVQKALAGKGGDLLKTKYRLTARQAESMEEQIARLEQEIKTGQEQAGQKPVSEPLPDFGQAPKAKKSHKALWAALIVLAAAGVLAALWFAFPEASLWIRNWFSSLDFT